jgi:hypothetical protein
MGYVLFESFRKAIVPDGARIIGEAAKSGRNKIHRQTRLDTAIRSRARRIHSNNRRPKTLMAQKNIILKKSDQNLPMSP